MIGKENIEEKIFEYFEGDLSAAEAKDLENFVQTNPEYQADFDAWKSSSVEAEPFQYKHMEDLLVNEKASPVGWFKWASGGAFMLLLSFASFGIFQKMNSENITEVSSIHRDGSDTVLEVKSGFVKVSNNVDVSKPNSNTNIKSSLISEELSIEHTIDPSLYLRENISVNKNTKSSVSGEVINKRKTNEATVIVEEIDVFRKLSEIYIDQNGINKMLSSQLEDINKIEFDYEDPNKKKEYPILLNLEDPYLNYNLAHTLEENGSFAGSTKGIRGEFLYRTEWPSATSESYESQIGSVDWYSKTLKGGVGVILNRDMIGHGKLSSLSASVLYAPKFVIKGVSLIPSFKYTFNNKSISWDQVKSNDIKDPRNGVLYASIPLVPEGTSSSDFIYHDFGFGMLVNANKFYAGFQYDHVNAPSYKEDFFDQKITIPGKYSVQLGTDIKRNDKSKFVFSPSLNYVSYGNYNTLWTNGQVAYSGFMLVAGGATNSDLMFSVGYTNAKVRLVYGLGFSKPGDFSGLEPGNYYESHQLSLRVHLNPKKR
jgi:type IX secretion system PorP/SprF family membrane protein